LALIAVQLIDALLSTIAKRRVKDDLDHLGFPEQLRFVFPIIKCGSAAGLLAGLRWPSSGRLTAWALIVYFIAAMGFHSRAHDTLLRHMPAAAMLAWSALVLRSYRVDAK
jgi:hypothetical protein